MTIGVLIDYSSLTTEKGAYTQLYAATTPNLPTNNPNNPHIYHDNPNNPNSDPNSNPNTDPTSTTTSTSTTTTTTPAYIYMTPIGIRTNSAANSYNKELQTTLWKVSNSYTSKYMPVV